MHKGPRGPLMNAASLLTSVWPHSTAKHFAQAAGCTPRQAKRVLATGRVPGALRQKFINVLDRQIETNRQHLEAIERELKEIAHAEMVARAEERRAQIVGKSS